MKPQVSDPRQQVFDLDQSIKNLKQINLKLSRILRHLEEDRRNEKKQQKS